MAVKLKRLHLNCIGNFNCWFDAAYCAYRDVQGLSEAPFKIAPKAIPA